MAHRPGGLRGREPGDPQPVPFDRAVLTEGARATGLGQPRRPGSRRRRGVPEYALQTFDHDALDYVVKPVRKERLAQALERATARLDRVRREWDGASLSRLGTALGYRPVRPARLLVRHGAGHRLVPLDAIVRFSAGDGVVHAHTADGAPIIDYTLIDLEQRTAGSFVRVSRGDLVNIATCSAPSARRRFSHADAVRFVDGSCEPAAAR